MGVVCLWVLFVCGCCLFVCAVVVFVMCACVRSMCVFVCFSVCVFDVLVGARVVPCEFKVFVVLGR